MGDKFRNWMFTAWRLNSKLEATELSEERKENALEFLLKSYSVDENDKLDGMLAAALEKLDNQTPEEFLEFLLESGWTREDLGLEENSSMGYTVNRQAHNKHILQMLGTYVDQHPELRFHQILWALEITRRNEEGNVKDSFYEESSDTEARLQQRFAKLITEESQRLGLYNDET